ncbi:MAG TPA: hypothetical protein ENJ13_05325 [Chromatiales bacterium]|nr:hypothetical protein [Chromatiales bacterium]
MKTLEPKKVDIKEIPLWFKESFSLIARRFPLFIASISTFFIILFFTIRAFATLAEQTHPLVLLPLFLLFVAFVMHLFFSDFLLLAFSSDNSRKISISERAHALIPEQKSFLKMTLMAFLVGSGFWLISLSMHLDRDLLSACIGVVERMLFEKEMPLFFMLQLLATMLYFMLLAMFLLRTIFCIPLMLFHELPYAEAKALSHRAIIINFQTMCTALVLWAILLLGTMAVANILVFVLFPLLPVYIFVCYRSIFLGQVENSPARTVNAELAASTPGDSSFLTGRTRANF